MGRLRVLPAALRTRAPVALAALAALSAPAIAHAHDGAEPLEWTEPYRAPGAPGAFHPLSSVPVYNSFAGADIKIYLDFVGETNYDWNGYAPGVTPAYDVDGDATTFSDL